ncbi:MAG: hypothetical protein ACU843_10090, partial [Gammaproteobacteria bacterium]
HCPAQNILEIKDSTGRDRNGTVRTVASQAKKFSAGWLLIHQTAKTFSDRRKSTDATRALVVCADEKPSIQALEQTTG